MIKLQENQIGLRCLQRRSSPQRLLISFAMILSIYSIATVLFYLDFSSFLANNVNSKFDELYDNDNSIQNKLPGGDVGPSISSQTWLKRRLNEYKGEEKLSRKRRQSEISGFQVTTISSLLDGNVTAAKEHENISEGKGEYPPDIFDLEARRKGAIILHVIGMLYMFTALAIVCDEFFVPSLEVTMRRLDISDDVAGATFMAAGGSAPELFTSIIGVFLAKSNVGIGTIVGSAVFNILFVIGMCSFFSRTVLVLTWWPLCRDCFFYIISLAVLIRAFVDSAIYWYESLILLVIYTSYVLFMKYNAVIEEKIKRNLPCRKKTSETTTQKSQSNKVGPQEMPKDQHRSKNGEAVAHGSTFSYGIVQLMMHSLDPVTDNRVSDKSATLYALAHMKVISPRAAKSYSTRRKNLKRGQSNMSWRTDISAVGAGNGSSVKPQSTSTTVVYEKEGCKVIPHEEGYINTDGAKRAFGEADCPSIAGNISTSGLRHIDSCLNNAAEGNVIDDIAATSNKIERNQDTEESDAQSEASTTDMKETLDMRWPDTFSKRLIYLMLAPIMIPLWITLPDVRKKKSEKWFVVTFFGSILWIAGFSYLMVWWAHQIGETIGISESIMGLTFLAAGTSVPDLITSVIVARKGMGDMAVSSSVGSNIFDVTVGLPFPWLLSSAIKSAPVIVISKGLFCSIILLFLMLLFVVFSIAICRWKMNRKLGFTLLGLYVVFLVISLLLETATIGCPVNTH